MDPRDFAAMQEETRQVVSYRAALAFYLRYFEAMIHATEESRVDEPRGDA